MDKTQAMLRVLDTFHHDMRELLTAGATDALTEPELSSLLDKIREDGVWDDKNDVMLKRLVDGGKTPNEAFAMWAGSAPIRARIEEQMQGRKAHPATRKKG